MFNAPQYRFSECGSSLFSENRLKYLSRNLFSGTAVHLKQAVKRCLNFDRNWIPSNYSSASTSLKRPLPQSLDYLIYFYVALHYKVPSNHFTFSDCCKKPWDMGGVKPRTLRLMMISSSFLSLPDSSRKFGHFEHSQRNGEKSKSNEMSVTTRLTSTF